MKPLKNVFHTTLAILCCWSATAQNSARPVYTRTFSPKTTTIFYRLGETSIPIHVSQYGEARDMVYINLHDDEQSSVDAAKSLLQNEGGMLIIFDNKNQRNIRFRLKGKTYTFDPNRMFSREGIKQSLSEFKRISSEAVRGGREIRTKGIAIYS